MVDSVKSIHPEIDDFLWNIKTQEAIKLMKEHGMDACRICMVLQDVRVAVLMNERLRQDEIRIKNPPYHGPLFDMVDFVEEKYFKK